MTDIIYSTARTDLETLLQYNFTDVAVLKEALTAFPTSIDWKRIQEGNKRLALVGDAAMNVVVAKEAYRADVSKGGIDNKRQVLLCNANLNRVGHAEGIHRLLVCNPGTLTISKDMVATAVEAIIGAIFLDSGEDFEVVRRAMREFGLLEV